MKTRIFTLAAFAAAGVSAHAGDIIANYNFDYSQNAKFSTDLPGSTGDHNQQTVQFHGVRTGGTDTLVPGDFRAYCVEIGETIGGGIQAHPTVVLLSGATTNGGGISGPVLFDATRTAHLQTLWGSFFGAIGASADLSAAFQLAQWEISFDDDMTLAAGAGAKFWVDEEQAQAGITNIAEGWLADIRTGAVTNQQTLALLSGQGIQDLVTPVPEPGTVAALGLGAVALLRRRKSK